MHVVRVKYNEVWYFIRISLVLHAYFKVSKFRFSPLIIDQSDKFLLEIYENDILKMILLRHRLWLKMEMGSLLLAPQRHIKQTYIRIILFW